MDNIKDGDYYESLKRKLPEVGSGTKFVSQSIVYQSGKEDGGSPREEIPPNF